VDPRHKVTNSPSTTASDWNTVPVPNKWLRCCAGEHSEHPFSHIRVSVCVSLVNESLYSNATPFSVCCVHLAVLGTVGGGLALSAHKWLLQRLAIVMAQRGIAVALARCVLRPGHLVPLGNLSTNLVKPRGPTELPTGEGRRRAPLRPPA
jgi:hypothetical protein